MDGIKVAAGVVLTGFLAAAFYSVGIGGRDGRELSSEEQFRQEAQTLLKKQGYEPRAVTEFAYYENSEVAQIKQVFSKDGKVGAAHIGCSGTEVLESGTHCRIGSVIFELGR